MTTILITNDDGIDSPTLVPLARALRGVGDLRVVVPSTERSWIGKAITRFEVVDAHATERDGIAMYAVTGTPADCVSLGVHTLYREPPHLVVSGINLGLNFGLAFLLSSGTVGGALEAWIAGVPSVAFSMALPDDAYGLTGAHRALALGERATAIAAVAADIVETLLRDDFPPNVDFFSVNMPADATPVTPRVVARVTRSRYGRLFVPAPEGGYLHRFHSLTPLEASEDGDMQVVARGAVAITPVRLDLTASLSDRWRASLARDRE